MAKTRILNKAWYWLRSKSGALSARYFSEERNIILGEAKLVNRILLPEEQELLKAGIHQMQRQLKQKPVGYEKFISTKLSELSEITKKIKI